VASGQRVIILNRQACEALFGDEPALGRQVFFEMDAHQPWKVVGVTGNFKTQGEFQEERPMAFLNHRAYEMMSSAFVLKVNDSADAEFEAALLKELNGLAGGANIELSYLTDQRRTQHNLVRVPLIIAAIVTGFLLLNVALGLLSVLWYNIRKRREEIGLRRALGATRAGILGHFIGEALVIALFGMAIGLFFAVQLPVLNVFNLEKSIYFQAIGASVLILALLVVLCALYPSRAAARVQPAAVLHEE
jgi:putative ABC transport system permease protein